MDCFKDEDSPSSPDVATDPVVLMCIIEEAQQANHNWPMLRDELLPMLLQCIRSANFNAPIHILKFASDGYTSPALITEEYFGSSKLTPEKGYTHAAQITDTPSHLVVVAAANLCGISDGSATLLAAQLYKGNISLHTFMTPSDTGLLMDVFKETKVLRDDPHAIVGYPFDAEQNWIYRSTRPRNLASVGSVILSPVTFSADAVVLDSNVFQSSSSALVLQESQQSYDWDSILAMASKNM